MKLRICMCVTLLLNTATGLHLHSRSSIVGGEDASRGKWPWMVYLKSTDGNDTYFCGGSLINSQWVLTAAHCVDNLHVMKVVVGEQMLLQPTGVPYDIQRVVIYPGYDSDKEKHDIALLQLVSPVKITSFVWPVRLPAPQDVFNTASECWVTGWGDVEMGVPLDGNETLQQLRLNLVDMATCRLMYPQTNEDHLCAGDLHGGKDSCQGDSGGPLVCKSSGRFVQVGVVSFGNGCGLPGYPGVYGRVQSYVDYIQRIIIRYS